MKLPIWLPLAGAVMSWSTAGLILWEMSQRTEVQQLWGYRPLGLCISFWLGMLLAFGPWMSKHPQNQSFIWMSSLSGVLLSLGFMPLPLFPLMLIGFVPLLWVEHRLSQAGGGRVAWQVFKFGFNTFLIWNFLTTFWVCNSSLVAGLIAIVANSLLMCIPLMLFHWVKQRNNARVGMFALVAFWISFEWWHHYWQVSWPWLTLGNSFAHLPWLVQWYEYTGVYGGSLWVLLTNVILAQVWNTRYDGALAERRLPSWRDALGLLPRLGLAIILPLGLSLWIYRGYAEQGKRQAEVVAVQPNFEPHYEKFKTSDEEQLPTFIKTAQTQIDTTTDFLLFPETSFDGLEISDLENRRMIQLLREFTRQYPRMKLITGVGAYKLFKSGDTIPAGARKQCAEGGSCVFYETYNAAIQLSNESAEIPFYIKSKLVPGAETMPYIGSIPFFNSMILSLGGVSGTGLAVQAEREVFASASGKVAPLICYESAYGEYTLGYTRKGAEALFVVTNDGWWDKTPGHLQHLHLSRLRAIENRRYVVRSANTGITCFINQRGDIVQATQYNERKAIRGRITLNEQQTFYMYYGDLIARIALFLTGLFLVATFVKLLPGGIRKKKGGSLPLLLLCCFLGTGCEKEDLGPAEEGEIQAYIQNHNLVLSRHESGMYYRFDTIGREEQKPNINSWVEVRYRGQLLDGTIIGETTTSTARFYMNDVLRGWQVGLRMMGVQGRGTFIFPSSLAYGKAGLAPSVPSYAPLRFDIELIEIHPHF